MSEEGRCGRKEEGARMRARARERERRDKEKNRERKKHLVRMNH
jgi:hypothetical protein